MSRDWKIRNYDDIPHMAAYAGDRSDKMYSPWMLRFCRVIFSTQDSSML
jgi:hypothetical protein